MWSTPQPRCPAQRKYDAVIHQIIGAELAESVFLSKKSDFAGVYLWGWAAEEDSPFWQLFQEEGLPENKQCTMEIPHMC